MTKFVKRVALVLCLLSLCAGLMGVAVSAAYDPITATIPVQISLTGTLPEVPDTFKVEMTADDSSYPMPAGAVDGVFTLDMTAGEVADVIEDQIEIEYTELGVYEYTVKQLDLGNEDCYQDTHTYRVKAMVLNNADYTGFDLNVFIYRDDDTKCDEILFENRYANPDYVLIEATKTMDKKAPKDGEFQFELVDADGVAVQAVTNQGSAVTFDPILCNKIGSTTYTMREVAGNNKKIIYDKTEYTVTVDVTKDDNGDYVGSVTYMKSENTILETPVFANKTKPIVPNTGDNANIALWGGMMVVALAAIVVLLVVMKKKSAKQ